MTLSNYNYRLLIIILVLAIYYPTIFAPFNSIDDQLLVHQLINKEYFSIKGHFFPNGVSAYYRPLVTLTFEIDKYLWGLQQSFMHLENIVLHLVNALLLFEISRSLNTSMEAKSNLAPFIVAVLFAAHPLNTEAVNWVSARTDLMATTLVFGAFWCLLKALRDNNLFLIGGGGLCLLLGMLSKETALFIAPGFLLLLGLKESTVTDAVQGWWRLPICLFLVIATYFGLRGLALHQDTGVTATLHLVTTAAPSLNATTIEKKAFPVAEAAGVTLKVVGFYVTKLLQPFPLNFAHVKIAPWYLLPGVAVFCILPFLLYRRHLTDLLYLLAFLAGSAALLVVFTQSAWTLVAERYMYMPSGFFICASIFVCTKFIKRIPNERLWVGIFLVIFTAAVWGTVSRNFVWQDNITLYQDTVRKSPGFALAVNELALALRERGRTQEANTLMLANRPPPGQRASLNHAVALAKEQRGNEARQILIERIQQENNPELKAHALELLVSLNLEEAWQRGSGTAQRTLYQDTIIWLDQLHTLTRNPFHSYRMGRVYLYLDKKSDAQRCFAEAATRLPKHSPFREPAAKLAERLSTQ